MQSDHEMAPCEICGADRPQIVAVRPDLMLGGDTLFTMSRCAQCGVFYQHPRPSESAIGQYYPDDQSYPAYRRNVDTEPLIFRLRRREVLQRRCRLVKRYVNAGRLLDVGCATGDFLTEMQRHTGWDVLGLEPSPAVARAAAAYTGVPILQATPNQTPLADASVDAVTMWDVLEHVYRPREVLAEVARIVRPGGIVIIHHPNTQSLDRHIFGRLWVGYDLPRHLYLYPPDLLRHLMAEYGLHEVERRCLYGSHSVLVDNITYTIEAWLGAERIPRHRINRVLRSLPLRLLTIPYITVIDRLRQGGNIVAVFVKQT